MNPHEAVLPNVGFRNSSRVLFPLSSSTPASCVNGKDPGGRDLSSGGTGNPTVLASPKNAKNGSSALSLPFIANDINSSLNSGIRWKRAEVLGQGAFGVVYLGLNVDTGELMAVKQLNYSLDDMSHKELTALENEVNMLRSFRHPNIVRYIGTELTSTNSLCIFLEYIPGGSVKTLIGKFGPLNENVVKSYARQLLLGLEYLHRNGIAHRFDDHLLRYR